VDPQQTNDEIKLVGHVLSPATRYLSRYFSHLAGFVWFI
jgi:hypothetical protein